MLLLTPTPHVKSHQINTMLFAYHKMRDLVSRPEDKLYVDCYLTIATMPFQDLQRWVRIYADASALAGSILRRSKLAKDQGLPKTAIHPDILDLTVVVMDLVESQPGDAYWPQIKMIKALRLSANQPASLIRLAEMLGVVQVETDGRA